jgi:methylmalonyl-CoA mutase N-terminal domain/subunit
MAKDGKVKAEAVHAAVSEEKARWEKTTLKKALEKSPESKKEFTTTSGKPIMRLYTPGDLGAEWDYVNKLGFPGDYPYTRGIHPTMYRGRLWTHRLFSGFATARETNERYKLLLKEGQTGLSVAFDFPTINGYDSDSPLARGEVGKCGVAISSLADMEVLFDGIPLDKVTTSMTINAPAAVLLAFYICVGEKQGVGRHLIGGTIQNDILKEYIAQKSFIFPPRPSMRLITDTIEYCSKHVPRWNTISISGYHIREAGSTAMQELAFTLIDGYEYVKAAVEAGMDVDDFAQRLSFFFDSHNDFFEEIAKFRAARRIWGKIMKEHFHARNERSCWLRFHTQTAGVSLMAQQPYNNVVRTTIQALAAVLGGTQSLHTNSLDETHALPTEEAALLALRTQQIIAHESGVANTIDPLGGSYFIEKLTDEMEEGFWTYFDRIKKLGGMVRAIEAGFPQQEVADSAYRYQKAVEKKEKIIVGVNEFVTEEEPIEILYIGDEPEKEQRARLEELRGTRSNAAVKESLGRLRDAAAGDANVMPHIIEAARNYATLGEIVDTIKEVFGEYVEPPLF